MEDGRSIVKHPANSVAAEHPDHGVPFDFCTVLNRVPDVAECGSWTNRPNPCPHGIKCRVSQDASLQRRLSDPEHPAGVSMPTVENHGDIEIQDIAALETGAVRNAVADDMIDGRAHGLGKALVVQRRRDRPVVHDEVVAQLVQLFGGHPRPDLRRDEVKHLCSEPAGPPHRGKRLGIVNADVSMQIVHGAFPTGSVMAREPATVISSTVSRHPYASTSIPAARAAWNAST